MVNVLYRVHSVTTATLLSFCSSAEDYLSSAGNRMTRRQLRASLNNVNVLHQEFLVKKNSIVEKSQLGNVSLLQDIPLNHPSKSSQLPGCAHRNRYKSIWPNEKTRVVLRRSTSRHENEVSAFLA